MRIRCYDESKKTKKRPGDPDGSPVIYLDNTSPAYFANSFESSYDS